MSQFEAPRILFSCNTNENLKPTRHFPALMYRVLHRIGTFSLGCVTTKVPIATHPLFCDSLVRGSFFALLLVLVLLTQSDPLSC